MAEYSFSLEPFSPQVLAAYRNFPEVLDQSAEKVSWKLQDCPFGGGWAMVVRDENDVIVGLNAYQPVVIRSSGNETLRGHQSMDTVVHEVARGKGLFTRMYRAYYEKTDVDFVYGFPNRNSAPAFFGKLGWSRFGAVPMRLKPLRTGFVTRRLGLRFLDFAVPAFRNRGQSSETFTSFDDRHEAAWRSVLARSTATWGVDRTAGYLNWRYRDHPTFTYRLQHRTDGSFVVSTVLDKHDARILYVMEALGDPDTVVDILREVHAAARGEGAEVALLWGGVQAPLSGVFRKAGYFAFPERLRSNEINFGARVLTQAPAPSSRNEWFLSYSDSDTV